jgi:hypothetical protein
VGATSFTDLTGTATEGQIPDLPASKITTGILNSGRIPDLDASKITTGVIADARLSTNIPRMNANLNHFENTDQNGCEFRFTSKNQFQGEPKLVIERRDAFNALQQRLTVERATNDWAFRNSHASGGFQLLNNENDTLITTSDSGTNITGNVVASSFTQSGYPASTSGTNNVGPINCAGDVQAVNCNVTGVYKANGSQIGTTDLSDGTTLTNNLNALKSKIDLLLAHLKGDMIGFAPGERAAINYFQEQYNGDSDAATVSGSLATAGVFLMYDFFLRTNFKVKQGHIEFEGANNSASNKSHPASATFEDDHPIGRTAFQKSLTPVYGVEGTF